MKINDIINDKNKKTNWFNRNYFYIGTVLIIIIQIIIFNSFGWGNSIKLFSQSSTFMVAFYSCFFHSNWEHVLLNMLCFFVAGLYIERKTGTIKLIALVLFLCFFSGMAVISTRLSNGSRGFSNVNYALYGYIIIDYFFPLFKAMLKYYIFIEGSGLNLFDIISGAIVVGLIILAFFYHGGNEGFFASYPNDLGRDVHWPGLIVGMFTRILILIEDYSINVKPKSK